MFQRNRTEPAGSGDAVHRAVFVAVISALVLISATITAAAVTLSNGAPQAEPVAAVSPPAPTSAPADDEPAQPPAPPARVEDVPVGIADVVLFSGDSPQLETVPDTALAAYQRAAAVLGTADKRCHLDWTLVAALGHVVTGHGATGDSRLNERGVMTPKYAGEVLLGRGGKRVRDSDAGRLDGDPRFDRPVGPLQLAPSTWAVVGVDSDGDGRRNPHQIDDAALAVSVLLCAGKENLARATGRADGVRRVNDDESFVETVLAVERAYRRQMDELSEVPGVFELPVYRPGDLTIDLPVVNARGKAPADRSTEGAEDGPTGPPANPSGPTDPVTPPPDTDPPTDTESPTDEPTDGATTEPTDGATTDPTDGATTEPTDGATTDPTDGATTEATDLPTPVSGTDAAAAVVTQ